MKVVHSFANEHNVVWKELMYAQFLSSLLAKEHYDNIEFHTTKEIANVIDKLAFPYNNIITKNVSSKDLTWSMPKLRAYQNLKESFLHIDNDTFIFNPGECAGMMKGMNKIGIIDTSSPSMEIINF